MEQADWSSRWSEGRIGFHQSNVSDFLSLYADRILGDGAAARVLVPLCGKSLDMVFLAERGATVIGVEYVEQAVREFFAERGITPEVGGEALPRFSAAGYTLYAADFFELTAEHLGPIDSIFDRAALVALDAETRARYAAHLRELLPAGGVILLITFDYEQAQMDGPPFAVAAAEVHALFSDGFAVEELQTREILTARFREQGVSSMREAAYVITRLDS